MKISISKFTLTQESNIQKAIEKVFNDNGNKTIPKGDYLVTCPACVSMIIAKSDFGKRLLLRFLNVEENGEIGREGLKLDYQSKDKDINVAKFSTDYLTKLLNIFKYDDAVKITMKKDMPITIENEDFKVILAPRVEDE